MRINKYIASATGLSRRKADALIARGIISVNGQPVVPGQDVSDKDSVLLDGRAITPAAITTIMLNKPVGYVVSRDGQGSRTIYELLPKEYQHLKPVGRLDKNSSGLLLLTTDGDLAQQLTHPSHQKTKIYEISLYKPLDPRHRQQISEQGIQLEDGLSKLQLKRQKDGDGTRWIVTMHEGRNRQIRRTFLALRYEVKVLHRTHFGEYELGDLKQSLFTELS